MNDNVLYNSSFEISHKSTTLLFECNTEKYLTEKDTQRGKSEKQPKRKTEGPSSSKTFKIVTVDYRLLISVCLEADIARKPCIFQVFQEICTTFNVKMLLEKT